MNQRDNNRIPLLLSAYPLLMKGLMRGYSPPESPVRINHTQWKALFILSFAHKPNMSQMSKYMNMEKGSLTSVVDGLIGKGLVNRIQDKSDRRKVLLELTDKSREIVEKGKSHLGAHVADRLKVLTASETDALFAALSYLLSISQKL